MRKAQKEQILNLLAMLQSAHGKILQAVDNGNFNLARQFLGDCQNAAIQIGTMIEETEGEGFVTVGLLEEYCELAYQIHEGLQMGTQNPRKLQKILQKYLVHIENSVKQDIPMRTEAVFLPYKASMWDSLESVWMAADEDPDCDAYVVPIPYYDRNQDWSFGEMHDESAMYPDYVPVVNYNDYDFEARRPDMVFIHNPYDNDNFVTSVPPFFYSENLKKYTDCLVYIPYFIEREFEPADERAVKHMEGFVLSSGVFHANYVVVQSEAMRQIYVDILTRHSGEETRNFWEGRILGLGSPKMDKVSMAKEGDFEISEEWKRHIYLNDACGGGMGEDGVCKGGNRGKVIFYNTSIAAFLQHGDKMLAKMRRVFQMFEQEQKHVTLLWRPHPLLPATIKSMRPTLYSEYEKIVEEYRAGGWGIYDDSADLNRAIAISDAYYGDPSSVVELFKKVGKPVMLQNVDA